jgi:DNA-binding IclR family transcriptional regulator
MAEQQGIQSVDAAMRVLKAMSSLNRPMSLKEIAAAADMTASNTHRYMVSFIRADLAHQESDTGRYGLGPFAIQLGLAAMARMDAIGIATRVLTELRDELDLPVTLVVWTPDGPTTIRWLESSHPLTVNIKPGSRAPMLTSASGRVYLSFEAEEKVKTVLAAELRVRKSRKESTFITLDEVEKLRAEVRKHRLGRVIGERVSGVNSISAPVFDATGQLVLSISCVGLAHALDPSYDGPVAAAVRAAGERASILLGYRPHLKSVNKQEKGIHVP